MRKVTRLEEVELELGCLDYQARYLTTTNNRVPELGAGT